jgi:DNA processing protein
MTMQNNDLLYQIALTLVPNIGDVHAKILALHFGSAREVFTARKRDLEAIEGMGAVRAGSIRSFTDFARCEAEIEFIEKYRITPLFITGSDYPQRLLNCYDSPVMLFYRGNANLNTSKILAVVGTRSHTDYGRALTEKIMEDLAGEDILVLSGLAFGIDSIAHKAALKHGLPTVGVLAHGLDRMYPAQNKTLAKQMVEQGGLLTDFVSGTNPDKQNFPKRNRIVAGMCDALLVVESGKKGGSLITAELANSYNKDVFALPGKATDAKSEGCNYLIKQNKALLVTAAADITENMGWQAKKKPAAPVQRNLFIELTPQERIVTGILQQQESVQIDELYIKSGLSSSEAAAALLTLEMQGIVASLPGKLYKLL